VVVEVQPGREHAPLAGEDQRRLRQCVFQPVERGVQIARLTDRSSFCPLSSV
jgi:hypothetical protein